MQISRRNALMGASAAVAVAGVPTAVAAKAALGGDPVLPAYEAFEAARREYVALQDSIHAVHHAVEAGMSPKPHKHRDIMEMSRQEIDQRIAWCQQHGKIVDARLGANEDDLYDACHDRAGTAYDALMDIEAATVAGLLCQVRAWWAMWETMGATDIPKPDPEKENFEPQVLVQRLYHDVARLAGGLPS